jgi:hypothetical protein
MTIDSVTGLGAKAIKIAWFLLVALVLVVFLFAFPAYFRTMESVCILDCLQFQLSPGDALALRNYGLSLRFYAVYTTGLTILCVIGQVIAGALIFMRRPNHKMAIFISFGLVTFTTVFLQAQLEPLIQEDPRWLIPIRFLQSLGIWLALGFYYLFPDGRYIPPWSRWVVTGIAIYALVLFIYEPLPELMNLYDLLDGLFFALFFSLILLGTAAQLYRYRRISGPAERQQTKWMVFGVALLGIVATFYSIWPLIFPSLRQAGLAHTLYFMAGGTINVLALFFFLGLPGNCDPPVPSLGYRRHHPQDAGLRPSDRRPDPGLFRRSDTAAKPALSRQRAAVYLRHRALHPGHRRPLLPFTTTHPGRHRPAFLPAQI